METDATVPMPAVSEPAPRPQPSTVRTAVRRDFSTAEPSIPTDEDDDDLNTILQDPKVFAAAFARAERPNLEPQPVFHEPTLKEEETLRPLEEQPTPREPSLPSGVRRGMLESNEDRPEPTLAAPGELAGPRVAPRVMRAMAPPEPIEATDPGLEARAAALSSPIAAPRLPTSAPRLPISAPRLPSAAAPRLTPDDTRPLPPVPSLHVAPLLRRLVALTLDAVLAVSLAVSGVAAFSPFGQLVPRSLEPDLWLLLALDSPVLLQMAGALAVLLLLGGLMEAALGWTPGKGVLGLRVRNANGAKMGWARGALRGLLASVSVGLLGAGYTWIIIDRRCRALHEISTGTVTVRAG